MISKRDPLVLMANGKDSHDPSEEETLYTRGSRAHSSAVGSICLARPPFLFDSRVILLFRRFLRCSPTTERLCFNKKVRVNMIFTLINLLSFVAHKKKILRAPCDIKIYLVKQRRHLDHTSTVARIFHVFFLLCTKQCK